MRSEAIPASQVAALLEGLSCLEVVVKANAIFVSFKLDFSGLVSTDAKPSLICCVFQCLLLKKKSRALGSLCHSHSQWMHLALLPTDISHVPVVYAPSSCEGAGIPFKEGALC